MQDGAIARFARTRPRRRQRVLEFAVIVTAGAGYAYAMADIADATDRGRLRSTALSLRVYVALHAL